MNGIVTLVELKSLLKKGLVVLALLLSTQRAYPQECSCEENYFWLRETIEKNDAGFQYAIDQKGASKYAAHNDEFSEKVKAITERKECAEILSAWLRFFRKGHLKISVNLENNYGEKSAIDSASIIDRFKDWETYLYDEKEFKSYLSTIENPGLVGIWHSPPYKIGVKKVMNEFIGFIIEADGVYWRKNQVKFRLKEKDGKLTGIYYTRDHSARDVKEVDLVGKNYLKIDFMTLERLKPVFQADGLDFDFLTTKLPIFKKYSEKTAILRIPSFSYSEKSLIDSLIEANWKTIMTVDNLIIDVRNNGGGSDESFEKILPIIYTNPIRTVGVELLSTPLNNQRMKDIMDDPEWGEEDKRWANGALEKLNRNIGEFVNLDSVDVMVETFDTIYPYPRNVGIIINEGCGSTTEQFLLAAKQSQKVKLYGTTTMGVLDISNMYFIDSPCLDFKLGYSLSRSLRIPEMTIDNKGIQPDYYIDHTVPKNNWIDFVNESYGRNK